MRLSTGNRVLIVGYGIPFSMVAHRFDSEICTVVWVDEETDSNWIEVRSEKAMCNFTVHACQCFPLPKEMATK